MIMLSDIKKEKQEACSHEACYHEDLTSVHWGVWETRRYFTCDLCGYEFSEELKGSDAVEPDHEEETRASKIVIAFAAILWVYIMVCFIYSLATVGE